MKLEIRSRTEVDVKERCFFTTAEDIPPMCRESYESSSWPLSTSSHTQSQGQYAAQLCHEIVLSIESSTQDWWG